MARIIFFYDNEWDGVTDIDPRTEHSNFLAENTQLRDFNHPWRSRYGATSGWGAFNLTATNNLLAFKDSGAVVRTATIPVAEYNADTLAAEIETQMEAQTTDTFVVDYVEAGVNSNKIKIWNDVGNFELTCTNTTNAIWDTIGFSTAADRTGADNYVANSIRIHTYEELKIDLGAATSILALICRGHNIQSGGSKAFQGNAADTWGSPTVSEAMSQNTKIIGKLLSSSQSLQWWKAAYSDKDNPDTYLENGRIFLGDGFQPTINFLSKSRVTKKVDPSIIKRSEAGQISTIQLDDYEVWQYNFRVGGSTQKGYFETMFAAVKKSLPLWICDDPDNFPAETFYCQFVDFEWTPIYEVSDVWDLTIQVEELA